MVVATIKYVFCIRIPFLGLYNTDTIPLYTLADLSLFNTGVWLSVTVL